MKNKPPVVEEKGEQAPLWIISFADMISLLMAFFVMLLTMASTKSGKIANEGEGIFEATISGFKRSIEGFGLPEVFGGKQGQYGTPGEALYFDSHKTYYAVEGEETTDRTIDAAEERIRRVFNRLGKHAKTCKSQLQWGQPDFVVTPITFKHGQFVLDASAKDFLTKFTTDLQESSAEQLKLYIVGLASRETERKTAMDTLGQTSGDGSGFHPRQSALRQSMVHIFVGSGDRRRLGGPRQCNCGTVARFYRGRKGNPTLGVVSSFSTLRRFFDLARFCRRGYPHIIAIYALRHGICS